MERQFLWKNLFPRNAVGQKKEPVEANDSKLWDATFNGGGSRRVIRKQFVFSI